MNKYHTVESAHGIKATVIAYSVSPYGEELITFELEYPRFIHSEFMTHRMFSRNSASSRAIPIKAMHEHIMKYPQMPVHWGKNQPGMSAKEEVDELTKTGAKGVWMAAINSAISHSKVLSDMGLHKQVANRITEFAMQMKVVVSGTEWANFFHLRNHEDADPTIKDLAEIMLKALAFVTPTYMNHGDWHLPYVETLLPGFDDEDQKLIYVLGDQELTLEQAKMVSASCCAQVSYRKEDSSLEKAEMIYNRLIQSQPVHASPVEHQATPIDLDVSNAFEPETWENGITHVTNNGDLWSGNFRGWIQHRQLIEDHVKW